MSQILSAERLRQIQAIMERDPRAYTEIEFGLLRHAQGQRKHQRTAARIMNTNQRKLVNFEERCEVLERRLESIQGAFHSLAEAAGRSLTDWESDRELAWIYGLLRGWEECETEIADKFSWTSGQRRLHARYQSALHTVCQAEE